MSVDSKVGAEQRDFTLRLETIGEGKQKAIQVVASRERMAEGWREGGSSRGDGGGSDATPKEIAERVGVSPRYVQKLAKENHTTRRRER